MYTFIFNTCPPKYKMANKMSSHFVSEMNRNKGPLFRQKYAPLPDLIRVLKSWSSGSCSSYPDKVVDDSLMGLEASGGYSFTGPFKERSQSPFLCYGASNLEYYLCFLRGKLAGDWRKSLWVNTSLSPTQ